MPAMTASAISPAVLNRGSLIQVIAGIQGVGPGGPAQVQINPNRRVFGMNFQCGGIAYTQPVLTLGVTALGSGTAPVFALTIQAGQIVAVAATSPGSGLADGTYTVSGGGLILTEPTTAALVSTGYAVNQYGQDITVTIGTGAVTSVALVGVATAAAVPPSVFFNGQILITVGGVNMRDISALTTTAIAAATSEGFDPGEYSVYFVDPARRFSRNPEATIWDLWGQSVLQLQMPITPNITNPTLTGCYEFDANINLRQYIMTTGANGARVSTNTPLLQPVAQHTQVFPIQGGSGPTTITTIPFLLAPNVPLPILRLWMQGSLPGNITQIEVDADGNKIFQVTATQMRQLYDKYGFNVNIFDAEFLSDKNQDIRKVLRCANQLVIYVWSSQTQQLSITRETLPGNYSGG